MKTFLSRGLTSHLRKPKPTPLVIERLEERTVLSTWLGQIGGPGSDTVQYKDPLLDLAGNAYISGDFSLTMGLFNLDPTIPPPPQAALVSAGSSDAFLAKSTSAGGSDKFIACYTTSGSFGWAQTIGNAANWGSFNRLGSDANSLYLPTFISGTGTTDFDPGPGTTLLSSGNGSMDAVVARYSKATGALVWAQKFGGTGDVSAQSLVVDQATNPNTLYVGGWFSGVADFHGSQLTANGSQDGFLLKLDTGSGGYQQVWQIGGLGTAQAAPIGVFNSTLYVTGGF